MTTHDAAATSTPTAATSEETTNPPTSEILRTHTLASRTINQHNTPLEIFGPESIDLLRRWVSDNTPENRRRLLLEQDMLDDDGTKALAQGDLAAYVMARYGNEGDVNTLTEHEVEMLKEWFENGGGQ